MQELCGDCVLLAPSLVFEFERNPLIAGLAHTASIARDDGNWTPLDASQVIFPARESVLRQGLVEDKTIDRRMRRAIEARVFDRRGKFTAEGEAQFQKLAPAFVAELERRFPITPSVESAIRDYAEGRLSGDDAWGTVMRSVQNLSVFSSWLTKDWTEVSNATLWIRQSGDRMAQSWLNLADRVTALVESQKGGNLTDEQTWAIGDKELTKIARRIVLGRVLGSSKADHLSDNALWS